MFLFGYSEDISVYFQCSVVSYTLVIVSLMSFILFEIHCILSASILKILGHCVSSIFLTMPHDALDLGSPAKDQAHAWEPAEGAGLTIGLPGKPLYYYIF